MKIRLLQQPAAFIDRNFSRYYLLIVALNLVLFGYLIYKLILVYQAPFTSGYIPGQQSSDRQNFQTHIVTDAQGNQILDAANQFAPHYRFTVRIPAPCHVSEATEAAPSWNVSCGKDDGFIIRPYGWEQKVQMEQRGEIRLNNRLWYKSIYQGSPNRITHSYGTQQDGIYYLVEIQFPGYSRHLEETAENILATFSPYLPPKAPDNNAQNDTPKKS